MAIWHNYVTSIITNGLFISIWSASRPSLSPILSCCAFHNPSVFLFLADVKLWLCFQQPTPTLANLPLNRGSFTSAYMQIIYLYFPPDTSHCGHFQQFHSGRHDAYLELPSHSFSLEISIITKPPTVKRLSKNARHLATLKSCGLTRGGGEKHAYIK